MKLTFIMQRDFLLEKCLTQQMREQMSPLESRIWRGVSRTALFLQEPMRNFFLEKFDELPSVSYD